MGQKPAELPEEVKRQNDFVWFFQTLDSRQISFGSQNGVPEFSLDIEHEFVY